MANKIIGSFKYMTYGIFLEVSFVLWHGDCIHSDSVA
jgi:hypothetical protein